MNIDQSLTIDTNALTNLKMESTHELAIIASAGQGGGALITPITQVRLMTQVDHGQYHCHQVIQLLT